MTIMVRTATPIDLIALASNRGPVAATNIYLQYHYNYENILIKKKARPDLVIPQLQPEDNIIPQLVNIIQSVKGWDAFSTFKSPKNSHFHDKNVSPSVGGAPSQVPYRKNCMIEIFSNGRDAFSTFKLPKISRLFDNNLSPGVGGPPSWKPYLKNDTVENYFNPSRTGAGNSRH